MDLIICAGHVLIYVWRMGRTCGVTITSTCTAAAQQEGKVRKGRV
ncbi:MAG: hypothetical protein ACUVSV_13320 [Armatimonadota bacterium]